MRFFSTVAIILTLFSLGADAAGFDNNFKIYKGDLNSDGLFDLYVTPSRGPVLISLDDIPIVLPTPVREFVLQNNGQGSFVIVSQLSPAQKTVLRQWPEATIDRYFRDVDFNGAIDMDLAALWETVPLAYDHVIYAPTGAGRAPTLMTSMDRDFVRFQEQLTGWMLDAGYFDEHAPLKVTSVEPAQRAWFGSIADPGNVFLMNKWLADCTVLFPGHVCGLSTATPPPPCQRTVPLYDNFGNQVGTGPDNICAKPVHVIIYTPGSVQMSPDYSVFDPDALETAEILEQLLGNCNSMTSEYEQRLRDIVSSVYGLPVILGPAAADTPNQIDHAAFPGDELFLENDSTWHHYDVRNKVCSSSQPNCNLSVVRDQVLRRYSVPHKQLVDRFTPIPGPLVTAHMSPPGLTTVSSAYVLEAGPVSQRIVQSALWQGAVQNVTAVNHIVYPGTISRYIQQQPDGLHVFTHGIGTNRQFCHTDPTWLPVNFLFGWLNDYFGAKAFDQLDVEMTNYWRRNYGAAALSQKPQGAPLNGPVVGGSRAQ